MFVHEIPFHLHYSLLTMFFVFLKGFVDKNASIPNFSLVNQVSLDKILKAEVFVHIDSQFRAAYLILDYIPIPKSFQVPKCVIKARDPRLQRISVAAPGFLITNPILEGILTSNPILEGIPKVETSSSRSIIKEKENEQEEEEEIVEVSDYFKIFNQPLSSDTSTGDLGQSSSSQSNHHRGSTPIPVDMGIQ